MAYVWAHSKRIAVVFKIDGQKYTTTIGLTPTKKNLEAVKRQCRNADARLRAGEPWESIKAELRGERIIVPNSLGYYCQHLLDHWNKEKSTLMDYQSLYNVFWIRFDNRAIDTLILSELQSHLATFTQGWKRKRNAVSMLSSVFSVAKKDKVISDAPTDDWEIKKGQESEPDPYTEVERDKLLGALEKWPIAYRYFLFAFRSGMRTGELLGLEWSALDKPFCVVKQGRVRRVIKKSTKTNKERRVRLQPVVWEMLESNPTRFKKSFVFLTPEDRAFLDADWLMDKWHKAHKAASVRPRKQMYPWRSTYISLALADGATPIWVSKQAGHDMLTMEAKYARWINDRDDADRMEMEKLS